MGGGKDEGADRNLKIMRRAAAGTEGVGQRVPSKKGPRHAVLMARWGMKLVFKSEGTSGNGRGGGTGATAQWLLPTEG